MLCYDIRVRYTALATVFDEPEADKKEIELEERLQKLNAGVYALTSEEDFYAAVYRADDDFFDFTVAAWPGKITVSKIKKKLEHAVNSMKGVSGARAISTSEITAKKFTMMLDEADNRDYLKRSTRRTGRDLDLNYFDSTLFFFLEDVARPGFTRELLAKVTNYVDVFDISEGTGNREEAIENFKQLIKQYSYTDLTDDNIGDYLSKRRKIYKCHDIHNAFNKWSRDVLRNKAYSAYKKCKCIEKQDSRKKGNAYEELQNMVGLSEVKRLADQIIASYKMQSVRDNYGFKDCVISKHMVFTGNPGSAKTTVARLLADILTDEGVLKSGSFVECGRADLVGRYVGWTAKEVRDKFKEAEGGMLFIDEAYSLVDDSRSYGDEAINTIVQEMENHRSNVIVIFAGYPDKMREFLNRNEGLRSRIAFHLDFPDYNENELLSIMELMLKERGLKADETSKSKCRDIFRKACKEKEFGNGRFVRNLIEQAMLKQAQRLMSENKKGDISRTSVSKLVATDFDVNIAEVFDTKRKVTIGFSV